MVRAFRSPFPMLATDDLPAALRFYRDLLGFDETYRFPDEGLPAFVALELEGASIGLSAASNPPIHGRALPPRGHDRCELCVYTDDLDTAIDMLRSAGVPVLVEPVEQPWGERIAYVTDPDDRAVMLTMPAQP